MTLTQIEKEFLIDLLEESKEYYETIIEFYELGLEAFCKERIETYSSLIEKIKEVE
jgi:ABC-type polysaccharide/polyol phosphate transport system ATPase subunit